MKKLTYEQWCDEYVEVDMNAIANLAKHHNIDAHAEIERIKRAAYQQYLEWNSNETVPVDKDV